MNPSLAFVLASSLIGISSASTIVQTESFSFVPNGSRTLTFDKFDTTLGSLTSVTVSVDMNKSGGRFEVDNDSDTAGTIDLTHVVIGQLSSSDVSLRNTAGGIHFVGETGTVTASSSLLNQAVGVSSGDSTSAFNATGDADYVIFEPTDVNVGNFGTIRSSDQADYTSLGPSTFDIQFGATQSVNAAGLSGLQQAFTVSNVFGSVTVTYNYIQAVPEPASSLLGGLGLLLALRRRR